MKRPNGSGTVYKLSGKRRNPWVAATSHTTDEEKQVKKVLGYFPTKTEALKILESYRMGIYTPPEKITLEEVYNEWKEREMSESAEYIYKMAWNYIDTLKGMRFADIRSIHIQRTIDDTKAKGKSTGTVGKVKLLWGQLYKHAMKNDIVSKDYSKYIEMPKSDSGEKIRFSDAEVKRIEKLAEKDPYASPILIMIYTGLRITELMELTRFNVDLDNMVITGGIKSDAGRDRIIPIHPKIQKHIRYWYNLNGPSLILTKRGVPMTSKNYRSNYFNPIMRKNGFRKELTPHSCRHTFPSMAAAAGMAPIHIQKIMGHTDYALTANVYTHPEIEELKKAMSVLK